MKLVVEFDGEEYVGETARMTYGQFRQYRQILVEAEDKEMASFEHWHLLLRPDFRVDGEAVEFDDLPLQVASHFLTEAAGFLRRPLMPDEPPTNSDASA